MALVVDGLFALLKRIARELLRLEIVSLELIVPTRVSLPIISLVSKEIVALDIKHNQLKEGLITKVNNRRNELLKTGEIDLFANCQASVVLELRIGMCIDVLCD